MGLQMSSSSLLCVESKDMKEGKGSALRRTFRNAWDQFQVLWESLEN